MGALKKYSTARLLKLYREKTIQLGRLPTAVEINRDPRMPSYATFLRRIGGPEEICARARIDLKKLESLNSQFCRDCLYNPRTCGRDVEECKKEGELYFQMLKKQGGKTLEGSNL